MTIPDEYDEYPLPDTPSRFEPGTPMSALQHRDFRIMWIGSFLSNIGSWMQTAVVPAYVYSITKSATWTGSIGFAQLVPLLLFSMAGGLVSDRVDRRRWLIALQAAQLVAASGLGVLVTLYHRPSPIAIVALVAVGGVANAFNAPAWQSVVPALVPRRDIPGMVSLQSVMINGSRIIGPIIGTWLYAGGSAALVFHINGATFLFVIVALVVATYPRRADTTDDDSPLWERLTGGIRVARADPVLARSLVLMPIFSLFCLPVVPLFAAIAEKNLGLSSKSGRYGLLYAAFGLGCLVGSLLVSTTFAHLDKRRVVRYGLVGFAATLFVYGLVRVPLPAYPVVFVVGIFYFGTTTALLTIVQLRIPSAVRGRVMALWFMGFGGTVGLSGLAFGPLLDGTSTTVVLTIGAVVSMLLAWWCDLEGLDTDPATVLEPA